MAIRAAKYQHLQVSYPTCPPVELLPLLTRDFLKEGLLWKTGPKVGDSYKKRWFTLDHRKLMYLEDPLVSIFHVKISLLDQKVITDYSFNGQGSIS